MAMNEDVNAKHVSPFVFLFQVGALYSPNQRSHSGVPICIAFFQVSREQFIMAAKSIRKRITIEMIHFFESWRDQSGLKSVA